MKFKPGEQVKIIRVDSGSTAYPFGVRSGMEAVINRCYEFHKLQKFLDEPFYEIWIQGMTSFIDCPESYLEKLKPSGWEKVSWDSMPWKPKELVT